MITIMCNKHRQSHREWFEANKIQTEIPAGTDPEVSESIIAKWIRIEIENPWPDSEDQRKCPDCSIVGLSKRGRIETLDSPDDWFLSDALKTSSSD